MEKLKTKESKRKIPKVKGIDLEHALNYIKLEDVGEEFIYGDYTSKIVLYRKGNRPFLENIVDKITTSEMHSLEKVKSIILFCCNEVKWAGYYLKEKGKILEPDRGISEEEIIKSGYGWCNEQARVACALIQILGLNSRLVFIYDPDNQYGHVIIEVLIDKTKWLAIDQSLNFPFITSDSNLLKAVEVKNIIDLNNELYQNYITECEKIRNDLGYKILNKYFKMLTMENPLLAYRHLGYYNYFIY